MQGGNRMTTKLENNVSDSFSYADLVEIVNKQSENIVLLQKERYKNLMFRKSVFYRIYKIFNK